MNDKSKQYDDKNYTNDKFQKLVLEKLARENTVAELKKLREECLKKNSKHQDFENKQKK